MARLSLGFGNNRVTRRPLIVAAFALLAVTIAVAAMVARRDNRPHVVIMGDSMTANAAAQFRSVGGSIGLHVTADGVAGLTFEQRLPQLQALAKSLPVAVIVELGTNDAIQRVPLVTTTATIAAVVNLLAPASCVLFVDAGILAGNLTGAASVNRALMSAVVGHPNMAVYDWSTDYHAHPEWSADTVHLKTQFLPVYASLVLGAARSHCAALTTT